MHLDKNDNFCFLCLNFGEGNFDDFSLYSRKCLTPTSLISSTHACTGSLDREAFHLRELSTRADVPPLGLSIFRCWPITSLSTASCAPSSLTFCLSCCTWSSNRGSILFLFILLFLPKQRSFSIYDVEDLWPDIFLEWPFIPTGVSPCNHEWPKWRLRTETCQLKIKFP